MYREARGRLFRLEFPLIDYTKLIASPEVVYCSFTSLEAVSASVDARAAGMYKTTSLFSCLRSCPLLGYKVFLLINRVCG